MPLRALVDGRDVVAPLVDDDEWRSLVVQARATPTTIVLPCCSARAYLRTSRIGLHHFVHRTKSPSCGGGRETMEHLTAKAEAARALSAMGFKVVTEAIGPNWRADVLAERREEKFAVEFQLSPISLVDIEARQDRYRHHGVHGIWLCSRSFPRIADRRLPLFEVVFQPQTHTPRIWLGEPGASRGHAMALNDFFAALFERRIRACQRLRTHKQQAIGVVIRDVRCETCGERSQVYAFMGSMQSACGRKLSDTAWMPFDREGGFEPDAEWFSAPQAAKVTPFFECYVAFGSPRSRFCYSPSGPRIIVRGFGCPKCRTLFDDRFMRRQFFGKPVVRKQEYSVALAAPLYEDRPHWCRGSNGSYCE